MISRACGALLRDGKILMVHHIHDSRDYWTLPGGGVHEGESPEEAVVREVSEETGLKTEVVATVFDESLEKNKTCRCFLLADTDVTRDAVLGHDPEEHDMPVAERMLQSVAWRPLQELGDDCQVSRVIDYLNEVRKTT